MEVVCIFNRLWVRTLALRAWFDVTTHGTSLAAAIGSSSWRIAMFRRPAMRVRLLSTTRAFLG
jgi:hypothetical protein